MRAKVLGGIVIFVMLLGALGSVAPAMASPPPPDYKPVDVGPRLRELGPSDVTLHLDGFEEAIADAQGSNSSGAPDYYVVGDVIPAIWYDDTVGLYLADYEVRAIGEHIEVWVMTSLDFPPGDPRNPVVVTQEQIDYLVDEFDNNIYPEEVAFFGPPDFHDGSGATLPFDYFDPEGRTIAMISNIGDANYYDPTYPNYIAGFYWGSVFEDYLDRNVISIDAYDWENRVGPDGLRPFLYEGVFAHEYQHLLHDDYDPDEVNWINEGLSMFSEFLTGYIEGNDAYSTFEELPENSLTAWGDQGGREIVADYGIVFLYQMYLYEEFGQEFIQDEFHSPLHDISSVNSVLAAHGSSKDFGDLYHDFSIAVLIDSPEDAFLYGFDELDVEIDIGHPGKRNPDAYDTPGAPPWGSDYILFWGDNRIANFVFNGYQYNPTAWTSDGEVLYSGDGDLIDNIAIFETPGGGELTFDTYWDIEDYWDFGFVQVSTDGGYTWTSLEGDFTTDIYDPDALPAVIDNLPGLTGWSCYFADDPCWMNLSYDLSAYAGQDILVAFRYMTDWGTTYEGWFIDNVYVDDTLISDGSSRDAFMSFNQLFEDPENAYTITFVGERNRKGESEYKVVSVLTGDAFEAQWEEIRDVFKNYRQVTMIVTYDAPEGATDYAPYEYTLYSQEDKPFKKK